MSSPGVLSIPFLRLRFALESERDAMLPAYKGSLLRGAFGHALRRAVCAMGSKQPCESCTLNRACVHARLFEVFAGPEPPPFLHGLPAAPRPFVFEPQGEGRELRVGDHLQFDLVLFGDAVELQTFAVLAVERMARAGLGVRRSPFRLSRASYQDTTGRWHVGFDRLTAVNGPSEVFSYGYDTFGIRVRETWGGVSRRFLYANEDLLAEYDSMPEFDPRILLVWGSLAIGMGLLLLLWTAAG